jgi:hypothetical protein
MKLDTRHKLQIAIRTLFEAKIPPPEGRLLELEYNWSHNDWYGRTQAGWFWYDQLAGFWRFHSRKTAESLKP